MSREDVNAPAAHSVFVTGIDTGVGKTVVSAVLVQAWGADYWKPVQAGDLDDSDTDRVQALVSRGGVRFHREAFRLSMPMSPHAAAQRDGIRIAVDQLVPPATRNRLVIEGAGGVLVPLNSSELVIDLIARCRARTIVVVRHYLGSINHTLLTIEALRRRNLELLGLVFCGDANEESEAVILAHSGVACFGVIPRLEHVGPEQIQRCARSFSGLLDEDAKA